MDRGVQAGEGRNDVALWKDHYTSIQYLQMTGTVEGRTRSESRAPDIFHQ